MILNPPHPIIHCEKLACYLNPKWCDVRATKTNDYGEIACPECHECRIGDDLSPQCARNKRATNKYNKRRSMAIDSAILEKAREQGFQTVIAFLHELHKTKTTLQCETKQWKCERATNSVRG